MGFGGGPSNTALLDLSLSNTAIVINCDTARSCFMQCVEFQLKIKV